MPLFGSTFVSGFYAEIDGKKVHGVVKGKQEALEEYEDAISSGHGSYLGQVEKTETGSKFEISVGNLPPNKTVEIGIEINQIVETSVNQLFFF